MTDRSRVRPRIIGHRGAAAAAPENTLASLRAGLEGGSDRIEFDVRLTADHHPVLLHDQTVDRTTDGKGLLASMRWEEVAPLDAGSWFGREFRGEGIPDLEEALRLLRPRLPVVVELKSESGENPELVEAVLEALRATGGTEGITVSGKRWQLLREAAVRSPGLALALTFGSGDRRDPVSAALEIGATALHVNRRRLSRRFMERARAAGLQVDAYTVNRERALDRAIALGVDGIFTDDPETMRELLDRRFETVESP